MAVVLILVGAILIGVGVMVLGTTPGDFSIGQGSYEGGYSDSYRSGYSSGYYDGRSDREEDNYHGWAYDPDWYSGDGLRGYEKGYEDGYDGRSNAMNDLGYKPAIENDAIQVGAVLAGVGVIITGAGTGLRIKAHFDQVSCSSGR